MLTEPATFIWPGWWQVFGSLFLLLLAFNIFEYLLQKMGLAKSK